MTTIKKRGRPRKNPIENATKIITRQEAKQTLTSLVNHSTKNKLVAVAIIGAGLALINHLLKKV